ncbi:MAG: polysaccharide deacetylase family protein [Clostridia bacterium]|nr:polysaccharide deacetylase family protein [Clostridia bacterium]
MKIFYVSRIKILFIIFFLTAASIMGWEGINTYYNQQSSMVTLEPLYQGSPERKDIALTFNVDWGEEVLPDILKLLSEKKIKATFFITGRFAEKFPDLVKKIDTLEFEIGNHGYSHFHPNSSNEEKNKEEILKTEKVFKKLGVRYVKMYAPPYGECSPNVVRWAHDIGYKTVMWTIDTVDWKNKPADEIVNKVINGAHNGAIVLMHPKEATLEALPTIIDELKEQGFRFKTISQITPGAKGQNR